jgi:hypothetical protein
MAFGQQSGPPATARQVQELLVLLQEAGHSDFRDARGPMGFTQRQAAGRFTRDEADEFIERLQGGSPDPDSAPPASGVAGSGTRVVDKKQSAQQQLLGRLPAELLADELRRRNWVVIDPLNP